MNYLDAHRQLLQVLKQKTVQVSRLKKILKGVNQEPVEIIKIGKNGQPRVIRFNGQDYIWRPVTAHQTTGKAINHHEIYNEKRGKKR